jgi:hypothetical protein
VELPDRVPVSDDLRFMMPNEEEFLWRAADTKTVLNGTAALTSMEF